MGTTIRSEISEKNKYYIDRHRYLELKNFCLQYPTWKKAYESIDIFSKTHSDLASYIKTGFVGDRTATCAVAKAYYAERMNMVKEAALKADEQIADYIIIGVTEGLSYVYLKGKLDIPCSKDTYYDRYRKFFWILNNIRE